MFDAIARNPLLLLLFVLALLSFVVAIYLAITLHRREKKADQRLKQARADITDMTILFQTMRDIIGQQKKLAREFNDELEHKMEQVKHILNQGMEKNKQLYEKQQRITTELEEAQAQIDAIYRQIGRADVAGGRRPTPKPLAEPASMNDVLPDTKPLRTPAPKPPAKTPNLVNGSTPHPPRELPDRLPTVGRPAKEPAPPPDEDRLVDTGVTKASFTSWVAEDLTANDIKKTPPPRSVVSGLSPEAEASPVNGDAAREAFRALLNMPQENSEPRPALDLTSSTESLPNAPQPAATLSGGHGTAAMQQRVLEYSEAGMTVAEVSRELGIGKGEVRLMLSLAKQNISPGA